MTHSISALLALALAAGLAFADPSTTRPTTTTTAAPAYPLTSDVVTGAPLGDRPVVEMIDGREVRFASVDGIATFKADAAAMHKKMDDQIIAATKAAYPTDQCVVADEPLGTMGDPILYVHRPTNQLVEFCCAACIKRFKKTPEKYLAKFEAAAKAG